MKAYDDQSKSSENIRHGTISSFCIAVFVKEDRETGKVAQKPCLFTRQCRSVQLDSCSVCEFVAR